MTSYKWQKLILPGILAGIIPCGLLFAVMKPTTILPEPAPPPGIVESIDTTPSHFYPIEKASTDTAPWQALHYQGSGLLAFAVGKPVHFVDNVKDEYSIKNASERLISGHRVELGVEGCSVKWESINKHKNRIIIHARMQIKDIPIYGSYIVLSVNRDGTLASMKARGFGNRSAGGFTFSRDQALTAAIGIFKDKPLRVESEKTWLPIPVEDGLFVLHPCYMVNMVFENPELRPTLFISAVNGEILAYENRIIYDDLGGQITGFFAPLYRRDDQVEASFKNEYVRVHNVAMDYTDEMGNFLFNVHPDFAPYRISSELRGRWVDVSWEDGADAQIAMNVEQAGIVNLVWNDDNARLDERGLYYHTNFIHNFWKELDPDFNGLDYAMPAVCGVGNNFDNAFWNGHSINFGEGQEMDNFALYADIIYHEYGHGVTHHIYPRELMPYIDEPGALNEAWSDYFPCSITDEPLMGEGGLMRGNGYIRNLDNDYVYPQSIRHEVHLDSRIISAAMWHSREVLGSGITDPLFHYARYEFGNQFVTYFTDVLITDDDDDDITNGTPNYEILYEQFGRHGIGPGVVPKLNYTRMELFDDDMRGASGNDNGQWEAGETIRIELQLERKGFLYPPPAEDVQVILQTDHPSLDVLQDVAEFGDMRVEDQRNGDRALLVGIDEDAELSFASLYFTISSDDGEYRFQDTLRIPIGRPPVLLVRDGYAHYDRSEFYEISLDEAGIVYDRFSLAEPVRTLEQRLELFETVVWFTGDSREEILEPESIDLLENFLDNGGKLLLTGQSACDVDNAEDFLLDYMGVESVSDSIYDFEIHGVEGDPVSDGKTLLILGYPGAMNQKRPSVVEAVEPAVGIYHWRRDEGIHTAGVRRIDPETGSHTIMLAFGLEAVSGRGNTNTRSNAIKAALNWLGVPSVVPPIMPEEVPIQFAIGTPYPNPFNNEVRIPVYLSQANHADIRLYDVGGRLISSFSRYIPIGNSALSFNGSELSAGLYLLQVEAGGNSINQRLVLIK